MRKRTHDEFLNTLKSINPNIEVLEKYTNVDTPLKVKCISCGKTWYTTPNNLLVGHGCGRCSNRKSHSQFIEDLTTKNPNIEVLGQYVDANTPIAVKCKVCGLEWNSKPRQLIGGHGCRQCANKKQADTKRKTQEQFESELTIINPNIDIVGIYKGSITPIECKCKKCGYMWSALPGNLLKGRSCPRCASYLHTSFPEQVIYFYIHKSFPDAINSYKFAYERGMELDIFIPSRNIGIEYDGKAWHTDSKAFQRETKKYSICRKRNIKLMRIKELQQKKDPLTADQIIYTSKTIEDTLSLVANYLGVKFDANLERDSVQIFEQYLSENVNEQFIQKLKKINPDIIPLSSYTLSSDKISCKCIKCDHIWMATPNKLLAGRGCPKCSGKMKKNTKQFIDELKTVNSKIEVIGEYINISSPILVHCKQCNYIWSPTASSILHGNGCPKCAHRLPITHEQFVEELNQVNPNIEVISEYKTKRTPILVRCTICGREWQTTPDNLLRKHGCANCARNRKKTTDEFAKELSAINKNFRVVGEYVNARTKIKVICKRCGYERISVPYSLVKGLNCPNCDK